jgi:acetyl esterase/lipase
MPRGSLIFGLLMIAAAVLAPLCWADEPQAVLLWPNGAPGSEGRTAPEVVTDGTRHVSSINNPSLLVYLPKKAAATGAAVIVLPGGAHKYLSIENEGTVPAQWLDEHGVAGIVLKYRLAKEDGSPYKVEVDSWHDAQRAVRMVRSRASEWGIEPSRVGVLGFSAGGEVAIHAATRFDAGNPDADDPVERQNSRPDFLGLIYAAAPRDLQFPKNTPPTFICLAWDDKPKLAIVTDELPKLREMGISTELHIYAEGGHGFGMHNRPLPVTSWPTRFYDWLGNRGFLKAGGAKADQ